MAINSDIRDQAYQFFIEEAPELLQVIEANLLTLVQDKSTGKVHNLMRAAHSLKGGAASVELEGIATLAHRLETIFKALYNETLEIDLDLESQLLQAYDCLRLPLIEQITKNEFDAPQALALAEPIFALIEDRLGDALNQSENYIPSSAELGIDLNLYIFEIDVQEGLEHLARVIASPQEYEVAAELQAQVEVFAGFAEILDQPAFTAIAQTALTALNTHHHSALKIAQLALNDFQAVREVVLSGIKNPPLLGQYPSIGLRELATVSFTPIEQLSEVDEQDLPSLEDIFGNTVISVDSDSEVDEQDLPSLEDIFGSTVISVDSDSDLPLSPQEFASENSDFIAVFADSITKPQTLAEAVGEIEQVFEQLPSVNELVIENSASSLPKTNLVATPPLLNNSATNLTDLPDHNQDEAATISNFSVRVDSERLGRMNNLVGELAINRNGLSLQNEQLQSAVRELLNRFVRVQDGVEQLQTLSNQMLAGSSNHGFSEVQHSKNQQPVDNSQFDSLELDRYGVLPSRLQGILEEMMQLEESVEDILLFATASDRTLVHQRKMLTQLRDELIWARMLPISEVLQRFPRILRNLSATYHKPVNLKLSGTRVLVDKAILEKLYDPLLHLLRNAFDHGIESSDLRRQKGKPEQGKIEIRAYHQGSQTILEITDDGGGLNLELIRIQALERGLVSAEQLADISNNQLSDLIFKPGFSTASQVSELSGRGVGLDVVRLQLQSLKGTVSVNSSPSVGTTFTLRLPLTLTIAKLLVCFAGSTALAIPSDSIEEIIIPKSHQLKQSGKQRFLLWREQLVPTYRLADFLSYTCPLRAASTSQALTAIPTPKDWELPLLILRQSQQYFALEVERLVTEKELTIKPFGSAIAPPRFTYGCTTLGDGRLIPVIDAAMLLESLVDSTIPSSPAVATTQFTDNWLKTPTVLVVDDAVALRRTLALSLERAGYRVLQAPDGREAIAQLKQSTVELVICDVEMPNMNGFEFLGARRQEAELSGIPVVMLTSRSNDKHRWLAMQLGATDYFTKPYLEREFLKAIKDIINS
jgi:two-component system, chemotaxis family, sensor histidine kinase and response regulator PixL